ncbi:hypothetical protein H4R18_002655 [Coemansia javaensis]|uniref:Uncharacterized protein n=1 Tax=Coemansia javaensis TaxID=2761396 RepID=A0A9W8LJQ0_9FUNG|nr:hypothetical protein H4R18_002655 [Coemansia javaensis]
MAASVPPGIATREFSREPLLLRLDVATHAFYSTLESGSDKKMMELVASTANVSVLTRPATKKELRRYGQPGEEENTRNVRLKYQLREDNLVQSGAFDLQWGLRWLLSFVVLTEMPGIGAAAAARLVELVGQWLDALVAAGIHEVADEMPALRATLGLARDELCAMRALGDALPGRFNSACSLLFAGSLRTAYVDARLPRWVLRLRADSGAGDAAAQSSSPLPHGMSVADAQQCVEGIVPLGTPCRSSGAVDLRIKAAAGDSDETGLVQVRARVFDRHAMEDREGGDDDDVVLRFERDVAAGLRPGFVVEATLHSLDNGVHYIDAVTMVWPSYTPLDYCFL